MLRSIFQSSRISDHQLKKLMKSYVGEGYTIYKHTNLLNGKCYIGQTKQTDLTRRWTGGSGYRETPRFNHAIKKYGWSGFTHEILETGLTKEEADEKEIYYIKKYRANERGYGYNIREGGHNCGTLSPEGRAKIVECSSGANAPVAKAIDIYDLNGNLEKTTGTLTEASAFLGTSNGAVTSHCKKGTGTLKGHICHYHDDTQGRTQLPKEMVFSFKENRKGYRPVAQYDLEGNLIKIYPSMKEAAKETKTLHSEISACLRADGRVSAGGYMWRDGRNAPERIEPSRYGNAEEAKKHCLPVLKINKFDNKDVTRYESLTEAAKAENVSKTTLTRFIRNGSKRRPYIWQYA